MNLLSDHQRDLFLSAKPTELLVRKNSKQQTCVYFEHPTKGEDAPVYVAIGNKIANTGFNDLSDFYVGSDYEPILVPKVGIICKFEADKYNK